MPHSASKSILSVPIGAPVYDGREIQAGLRALRERRLSQGKYVRAFEEAWARYVGRKHGIAVNSGSSANLVALHALKERYGWRDGDAVLVPAVTFATAVMPVLQIGMRPVYADVDRRGNLTLENIKRTAARVPRRRLRGMVVVHSYGVPCTEIGRIMAWAKRHRLPVLEDACESHGARTGKKRAGAFGTLSTTSFFIAHNMTTGEGGMITADDPELVYLCRSLREFGRRIVPAGSPRQVRLASGPRYDVRYAFDRLGYNVRMPDIQAAIGLVQLSKLEAMNRARRQVVRWYRRELAPLIRAGRISLPDEPRNSYNTYYALQLTFHELPPRCRDLAAVAEALEPSGIETRRFMGGNLLRQKAFAGAAKPERFPMADFLHHRALFVGCHPLVSERHVRHVCNRIKELFA